MSVTIATPRTALEPVRRSGPVLQPQTFDQLIKFSDMVAHSDLVPRDYKGKPANVMVAVQMGSELGLAPMQSLQSIAVINGRPGVWGDGLIGLCRQSPLCEDIEERFEGEGDARAAVCVARRRGASPVTERFSVADAKKAGLWGKQGPWAQYPDRMLRNRARGFALRDAFPDVLRGLKTVEELRDYQVAPRSGGTVDHQPEPERQEMPSQTRFRDAVDADSIPALDEPAPAAERPADWMDDAPKIPTGAPEKNDPPAVASRSWVRKIAACGTPEALAAMMQDAALRRDREWYADNRPELAKAVQDALDERAEKLMPFPGDQA